MIHLRPLHAGDIAEVLRIQAACYFAIVPESRESLLAKILAAPATCLAAHDGGVLVGYLVAVPVAYPRLPPLDARTFEPAPDADTLYLHDLAVAAAGRGTGAGQALVRAALAAGRTLGLEGACLVAIQDSAPYWRQFGFDVVAAPPAQVVDKLASYGAGARLMRLGR